MALAKHHEEIEEKRASNLLAMQTDADFVSFIKYLNEAKSRSVATDDPDALKNLLKEVDKKSLLVREANSTLVNLSRDQYKRLLSFCKIKNPDISRNARELADRQFKILKMQKEMNGQLEVLLKSLVRFIKAKKKRLLTRNRS